MEIITSLYFRAGETTQQNAGTQYIDLKKDVRKQGRFFDTSLSLCRGKELARKQNSQI